MSHGSVNGINLMTRLTENDRNWGPFTWGPNQWRNFSLMFSTGDEEDGPRQSSLTLRAFGWSFRMKLPNWIQPCRIRHEAHWDEETVKRLGRNHYFETHEREFGISLSDMGNGYDFLSIHYGPQTNDSRTTKSWCRHLPWMQWDMVRHTLLLPDGGHFWSSDEIANRKRRKKDRSFIPFDEFWKRREGVPKEHFLFEDFDGEKIIATCFIEEREWHRGTGWFRWMKYFWPAKTRRSLDLAFSSEVGTGKGSWKGGTIGHGIDMREGEFPINAFKRYCELTHERKGRKYMLRYIGPCGPPPPKPKVESDIPN